MKRITTLFILFYVLSSLTATAQDLYVKSFQAMPTDMTASSLKGKRIDRNGEVAALIKVVTPETGFFFDGGALGVVDSKEETGEIWVWVPRASRKITIGHPQLGMIKNYEYPLTIESERTYEMVLTTEKAEKTTGSLGVDGSPDGATIYLNGKEMGITPKLITGLSEGDYELRVVKEGYAEHKQTVSVKVGERTQVTLGLKNSVPVGAIKGLFSVSETKKVYFSKGNLQYQASTKTWRFADNQWSFIGGEHGVVHTGNVNASSNNNISETYAGWIDLFGWGTSGYKHGAVCYQPWSKSDNEADYIIYGKESCNLHDFDGKADWGYNAIANGGKETGQWYLLDTIEWNYLLNVRKTACGFRATKAKVHETNGLILVPDDWTNTSYKLEYPNESNEYRDFFDFNIISDADWEILEAAGLVFLPAGGARWGDKPCGAPVLGWDGSYWASSTGCFGYGGDDTLHFVKGSGFCGHSVRLVHDAEQQWSKASVYSQIAFTVDADAEIWIDGVKKGIRTWRGNLSGGSCRVECRLDNHESSVATIEIDESKAGQTMALAAPRPIYGSLTVKTTPDKAKVIIDGNDMGETPISLPEFIIGQHELRLLKDDYVDHVETFTLTKGQKKQLNVKLNKGHAVQFTCNVCDAQLEIDGKKVGPAVGSYQLANGSHKMKATALWYRDCDFTLKVDDNSALSHEITMECVAKPEETFTVNGVSFTMKLVEGGTFMMGNDETDNEKPVHEVTLSTYYMGETEVTQALWMAVMGSEPSDEYGGWKEGDRMGKGDNIPAYKMTWDECQLFMEKLNRLTGKNFRLPTEAEWEFAARGGNKSQGFRFAGSNNYNDVAWTGSNSGKQYHDVKTKKPNELGLYDMSGNAWEWCSDYYLKNYSPDPQINPKGEIKEAWFMDNHVLRSGGFYYTVNSSIVTSRTQASAGFRSVDYGFRLCLPK